MFFAIAAWTGKKLPPQQRWADRLDAVFPYATPPLRNSAAALPRRLPEVEFHRSSAQRTMYQAQTPRQMVAMKCRLAISSALNAYRPLIFQRISVGTAPSR